MPRFIPRTTTSVFVASLVLSLVAVMPSSAEAQALGSRPLFIITGETGGGLDVAARLLAPGLSAKLGQQVVVENRGFAVAPLNVSKAKPDGQTLLFYGSPFWLAPFMREVTYDPLKDFLPISLVSQAPTVLVVHPSLPVHTVQDLVKLAKARPGALTYAASAPGSPSHMAGELFKAMAKIDMLGVPYKGAGQVMNDLLGGQIQLTFAAAASIRPYINSGRLRAIAVTSAQPTPLFPGLPAVSSADLAGYKLVSSLGFFAPAGTPAAVISSLNEAIVQVATAPALKERFFNAGAEVIGGGPKELEAQMRSEMDVLGKLIRTVGIRSD
jgi:tripartite-type tricarboxylate transporter receptor subunit TctC